jgi:hypothetical protein
MFKSRQGKGSCNLVTHHDDGLVVAHARDLGQIKGIRPTGFRAGERGHRDLSFANFVVDGYIGAIGSNQSLDDLAMELGNLDIGLGDIVLEFQREKLGSVRFREILLRSSNAGGRRTIDNSAIACGGSAIVRMAIGGLRHGRCCWVG